MGAITRETADKTMLYNCNTDFKQYVDKYAKQRNFPLNEALQHALVKSVGDYYIEEQNKEREVK